MEVDSNNSSTKLKRCISVPAISSSKVSVVNPEEGSVPTPEDTPKKIDVPIPSSNSNSRSSSREVSPAPAFNIFSTRARRYSASFSPLSGNNAGNGNGPRLSLRVSQLRQEECADVNSREQNHEREVHSAMQISQSWEDLTLVAENWSCKSADDVTNPLQVVLPSGIISCSSPSPTSRGSGTNSSSSYRALPYGLSPSPTRRTFATRRSMSPIAMRPSQLGVKRRFDIDGDGCWSNAYSPPPFKKIFVESRASSPSSSVCASPDSGTYEGRMTPKLFISKLCTSSNSPIAASPSIDAGIDMQITPQPSNLSSSSSSSSSTSSSEEMKTTTIMPVGVAGSVSAVPPPPLPVSEDTQFC
ncbi:FAM122B family protein [Megaselia abdita]